MEVGFNRDKRVKGRKRHMLTDTLGPILCVVVTVVNDGGDREGPKALLERWFILGVYPLRKLQVDAGHSGQAIKDRGRGLKRTHKIDLAVTDHDGKGFVERAFAWLLTFRRHSKDYEVPTRNSELMIPDRHEFDFDPPARLNRPVWRF